ncbi:outer membrane beta-barrel family protein [Spirosoma terrae]|uniref:TonB-dependent receptor n=1 Tax=Spirosoma terrae TaxID=1968276 RepID=A0A6L9LK23_9BACT|nr:outer membrane beta-barrel family protein [Spirosoma terrae]NDU96989.1 TonB-dependent receptor [Spirosoma terrae]
MNKFYLARFGFFSLLAIITLVTSAQSINGQIDGRLADSVSGKPIPFATIVIQLPNGQLQAGTNTDQKGVFVLDNVSFGTYQLVISSVGYQTKTRSISLMADKQKLTLALIKLLPITSTLTEVNVIGKKPIVEDKGDHLVYNAAQDITNAGGSAIDVMRKVPMVSIDQTGDLQLRGSSSILVLVNGKPSSAMANNRVNALKQIPASMIKAVEVMTSPGAKYDAEGSAGVINIIMKKAPLGVSGNLNTTAGNVSSRLGGDVSVRREKAAISLSANGYTNRNRYENRIDRTELDDQNNVLLPVSILKQTSTKDNTTFGGYSEFNLEYNPDSTNHLNASASFFGSQIPNNSILSTQLSSASDSVLQSFRRSINSQNKAGNVQLDLGWTKILKKTWVGSENDEFPELSILTQYSQTPDNNNYNLIQTNWLADRPTYLERSTNRSYSDEYTFQTDFVNPFRLTMRHDTLNCKLETGAKVIRRNTGSNYQIKTSSTGLEADYLPEPTQSDVFSYNQSIVSGYASLRTESKQHWQATIGLRFEYTTIQGDFITSNTKINNQYSNLIPNINLSKTINGKHTLKISYSQRLARPLISYLNPYRNYADSKNVQSGNPYLLPEQTHSIELGYSTFSESGLSFSSALFRRQTNNDIQSVTVIDQLGVGVTTPQNIGNNSTYGLNMSVSLSPVKSLNLYANTTISYANLTSPYQRSSGWMANSNLSATYKWPNNVAIQFDSYYTSGQILLQSQTGGWYFYGFAVRKEFMADKKAAIGLNLNNFFTPSLLIRNHNKAPDFDSVNTSILLVNRSIGLTFSYRFGKENDNEWENKKISNDDGKTRKLD